MSKCLICSKLLWVEEGIYLYYLEFSRRFFCIVCYVRTCQLYFKILIYAFWGCSFELTCPNRNSKEFFDSVAVESGDFPFLTVRRCWVV